MRSYNPLEDALGLSAHTIIIGTWWKMNMNFNGRSITCM